ncbi:MAG: SAM-dependent methyltransferase [Gemmatimonas sp.]
MIQDVSDTAFWVASYRAAETQRPDALFRDRLAERLSGERGRAIAKSMPRANLTAWNVVMRTVVIDSYIQEAIAEGIDVVLNLGAGLDTRPYRLELPAALRWIEVDHPNIIDFKERELANEKPRCHLQRVNVDLTDPVRRRAFLSETGASAARILVLTEGVVPYLTVADAGALADDLAATPSIKYWIVDYFSAQAMQMLSRSPMQKKLQNAPFQFFPTDWYEFFRTHGWKPKQMRYLAAEGSRLKRMIPIPWFYRMIIRLMSAEKRKAGAQFSGYALMERV